MVAVEDATTRVQKGRQLAEEEEEEGEKEVSS